MYYHPRRSPLGLRELKLTKILVTLLDVSRSPLGLRELKPARPPECWHSTRVAARLGCVN